MDARLRSGVDTSAGALTPGMRLGTYEIVRAIGAGGMGEVYRARDTRLGRDVAVKVLPLALAGDPARLDRLEREARLLAALNHPNIAHIHGLEESGHARAIVMELVEGATLADRIMAGALPLSDALAIAMQIAEALEAAHAQRIIHRDLKPANIKIRADGTVKVLDFGLGKALESYSDGRDRGLDATVSNHGTEAGTVLGTATYMSPEQAAGRPADERSDLWSFGVVLMEMLTGRRVFQGESASHVLASVLKTDPDWTTLPPQTPSAIRRLLRRCLRKDRQWRLADAADARLEIAEALTESPPTDDAAGKLSARRSVLLWLAIAGLVVAVAALAIEIGRLRATSPLDVRRLAVTFPSGQEFVDVGGVPLLFTPDGRGLVYSGRGPQGSRLYYRRLDRLEATPLPGTDNAWAPAMAPSGEWIVFQLRSNSPVTTAGTFAADVRKVALHAGAPIQLGTGPFVGLSWGRDGLISAGTPRGLFRLPANGGTAQQISSEDTTKRNPGHFMPLAMPDGRSVLVWVRAPATATESARENIGIVDVASGALTVLDGDGLNPIAWVDGYLVFGRANGTLGVVPFDPASTRSLANVIPVSEEPFTRSTGGMAASVSATGDLAYVRVRTGSTLTLLDATGRETSRKDYGHVFTTPRLSPEGTHIVLVRHVLENNFHGELWTYELSSGRLQRVTTDGVAISPEWTTRGRIVYSPRYAPTAPHRPNEIWWTAADGSSAPERLLAMDFEVSRTVLSPDGRYAVIEALRAGYKTDLYLVDLLGDRKAQPLVNSNANERMAAISPDGRWLAYASDHDDRDEVYVRAFPDGSTRHQISLEGGTAPRWTKGALVYSSGDRLVKATMSLDRGVSVHQRKALEARVTSSGNVLRGNYSPTFDVFPDGRIVMFRPGSADAEVIVVTNWLADVKRRAGVR